MSDGTRLTNPGERPLGEGSPTPTRFLWRRCVLSWPVIGAIVSLAPYMVLLVPDARVIPDGVYCDYGAYQLPVREFAREELLEGRFPLWIPYLGCGMPLHAGQQASLAYLPLMTFVMLCGANVGIKLSLFLHLLAGYVGEYRLARQFGVSRAAATLAACVTAQSGFVVTHLMQGHVTLVLAYGLIPWFFLCVSHFLERPEGRTVLALGWLVAAFVLIGHPQMPYYALLCGLAWGASSLVVGAASRHRLRAIAWSVIAAMLALCLAAIQLLPTLELMADGAATSERGSVEYAGTIALAPLDLLRFVVPDCFGNLLRGLPEFQSPDFFHEKAGYLGWAVPLLAFYGLTRANVRRWELGVSFGCVVLLVIALGNATAGFAVLGRNLPGLCLFRCPGRVLAVVSCLFPLVAASGLDALLRRRPMAVGRQYAAVAFTIWVIASFFLYHLLDEADQFPWERYRVFAGEHLAWTGSVALLMGLTTVVTLLVCRTRRGSVRAKFAGVLIVALADLWNGNGCLMRLSPDESLTMPPEVRRVQPPIRFAHVPKSSRDRGLGMRYSKLVPTAVRAHRSMIGTNEGGVVPAAVERLYQAVLQHADRRDAHRLLAALSCQWVCTGAGGEWLPVESPLPRLRFLPDSKASLAEVPITDLNPSDWPEYQEVIHVLSESSQSLVVEWNAEEPGSFVVADTAYPGWSCSIDGIPSPTTTIHGVFRGTTVGAGHHRIEMTYSPLSFRWGVLGSVLGLIWSLLLWWRHRVFD